MRFILISLLITLPLWSEAQEFGGTPPEQKWRQINTDSVRVIFPAGMDSQANRIAAIVHSLALEKPRTLGDKLKKINIVLQHQTTIANGYAGLGPFRSEFYLTPSMNNFEQGSVPWTDQLATHEYRHIQQYNNFRNGISNLFRVLSGEEGYALAINAAIPDWFFEGDAVQQETYLSKQGRGRLPLFLNAYPSLWQAGKKYSWMKLRNGSLKDYIPNHYYLGYLMVNYGEQKYGPDFWKKVTRDASAYKKIFYPFQAAIKQYSGITYKQFREEAFKYYQSKTERVSQTREDHLFPVRKSYVTNYQFPYAIGHDSLVYLKSTYRHRPTFIIRDNEGEKKLRVRDISIDEQYSYRNGKIVYAAYRNDPRWNWRDYSEIRLLDVISGRQKTVTHKSKYFTPDISPDGKQIVAVQVASSGRSELHILNSQNGEVVRKIHSTEISLFTDPKFVTDSLLVTAVRLNDGRMALALAETETGITTRLTDPSFNVLGFPSVNNDTIYFTASYGGNDDVFCMRIGSKEIFRLTDGPLGNYFVNVHNGNITWSSFTSEGYQLKQVPLGSLRGVPIQPISSLQLQTRFPVAGEGGSQKSLTNQRSFPVSNYSKATGLLNFHSWRPDYSDPIFRYSIFGQNILNTMQTELYYLYNDNEGTNAAGLNLLYGGWYPYVNVGTEYTFNRQSMVSNRVRQWDQLDTRIGLSIPLNETNGKTFKSFSAGSYYVLRNEFNKGFFKDSVGNVSFSYLLHTLSYTQQVQRAVQHIYPRLAYSVSMSHRHAISYYQGYQFFGGLSLYVPGFLSTHNLLLKGSFQQRDTSLALFSTRFPDARGYADYYRTNAGSKMWNLSANYHMPLLYPDWGFGNILYIQRLRTNLFYDHQRVFFNDRKTTLDLRSTGIEFFADTKWWNQYPLTFGFRISRLLDNDQLARKGKGTTVFEFVLPVSIISR